MSLPQHLTYQKGGVIYLEEAALPTGATVSIIDGDGTERMAHVSATLPTLNTTLSAVCNVGNAELSVASNTGFSAGALAWLRDDPEAVMVREVAGTTIHLRNPLIKDHISGAALQGARIVADINAAVAGTMWFDGRAEWNLAWSNGTTAFRYSAVECGKYPNTRLASVQDILDCEPMFAVIVEREADPERLLDGAHMTVLEEIAKVSQDSRARTFTGSMAFKRATGAAALFHYYQPRSSEEKMETWWTEFQRRLSALVTTTPRDADQDGIIEPGEGISLGSVRIRR